MMKDSNNNVYKKNTTYELQIGLKSEGIHVGVRNKSTSVKMLYENFSGSFKKVNCKTKQREQI